MSDEEMGLQPLAPAHDGEVISREFEDEDEQLTMGEAFEKWLKVKFDHSQSKKTEKTYREVLTKFGEYLANHKTYPDGAPRKVARLAQEFAVISFNEKTPGRAVSTSTANQRFAILSSYYQYCVKHGACDINPIDYCERPERQVKNAAPDLDAEYVALRMRDIDIKTLEGKRDMALISLAVTTGRRSSELAGLEWGHLDRQGNKITAKWVRCKGNKTMTDTLKKKTTKHLLRYMEALYGPLEGIEKDAPVFVSLSNRKRFEEVEGDETPRRLGLSHQSISRIFLARLGVTQVHSSRHTFAVGMSDAGASLEEIGDRLGHSNYKVTADYMKRHKAAQNKHGDALEEMFGL